MNTTTEAPQATTKTKGKRLSRAEIDNLPDDALISAINRFLRRDYGGKPELDWTEKHFSKNIPGFYNLSQRMKLEIVKASVEMQVFHIEGSRKRIKPYMDALSKRISKLTQAELSEDSLVEFEAWCENKNPLVNLTRGSGGYIDPFVKSAWAGWRAALKRTQR